MTDEKLTRLTTYLSSHGRRSRRRSSRINRSHDQGRPSLERSLSHPALGGFLDLVDIRCRLLCPTVLPMSLAHPLRAQAELAFKSAIQLLRGRLRRRSALWHQFPQIITNTGRAHTHQLEVCHVQVPGTNKMRIEHPNMALGPRCRRKCHFRL